MVFQENVSIFMIANLHQKMHFGILLKMKYFTWKNFLMYFDWNDQQISHVTMGLKIIYNNRFLPGIFLAVVHVSSDVFGQ